MSNWQDQFDFDEPVKKQPSKKVKSKNKKLTEDFDDFDDDKDKKVSKLPTITNKSQTQEASVSNKNKNKSKNIYDQYDEVEEEIPVVKKNFKASKPEEDIYEQQFETFESPTKNKPKQEPLKINNSRLNNFKKRKQQKEEQYYEEVFEDINSPKNNKENVLQNNSIIANHHSKKQEKVQEENYEEEFEQDYGEDFEEEMPIQIDKNKKKSHKENIKDSQQKKNQIKPDKIFSNQQNKKTNSIKKIPVAPSVPKPPLKKKNENFTKPKHTVTLGKSDSKKSLDSKRHLSYSRHHSVNQSEVFNNKNSIIVEKQFGNMDTNEMNRDRLNRLNEQMRQMIRKFNGQLNDLIARNMQFIKDKPQEREVDIEQKMKIYEEQIKTGQTTAEVIEIELGRLKGRQGEVCQEEFELILQNKIEETKQSLKQIVKKIHILKHQVKTGGNKLTSKNAQNKLASQLHNIKTLLMQAKKQQQKNQQKLFKMDQMKQELQSKNSDKQYELTQQIDSAKEKGVHLHENKDQQKHYYELKSRHSNFQNHLKHTENLFNSKSEYIFHDIDHSKIALRKIENQIRKANLYIEKSQTQSIELIKKTKQSQNYSTALIENLDKILQVLQENQHTLLEEIRSEVASSRVSHRPLKRSMYANLSKQKHKKNSQQQRQKPREEEIDRKDEVNILKPKFTKKKDNNFEFKEEKQKDERVWNEQELKKKQILKQQPKEENKNKPFTLKKNRLASGKNEQTNLVLEEKVQPKPIIEEKKQEEKPSIGPRMMKLKRNNKDESIQLEKPIAKEEVEIKKEDIQDEKPIIVPKRFNLRNKAQKNQEPYIPSIDGGKNNPAENEITHKINAEESKNNADQEMPKFSLRSRLKKEKDIEGYFPTTNTNKVAESPVEKKEESYNPLSRINKEKVEPKIEPQKKEENTYNPFSRVRAINKAQKQQNSYNPLGKYQRQEIEIAKKEDPIQPINIQLRDKSQDKVPSNPYAPIKQQKAPIIQEKKAIEQNNVYNPYANMNREPSAKRQGRVKKIKIKNEAPKQKINIYDEVDDLTLDKNIEIKEAEPPKDISKLSNNAQPNLQDMLGIKKKKENNDAGLDDLLGDINVKKKTEKKKQQDFFNDLQI